MNGIRLVRDGGEITLRETCDEHGVHITNKKIDIFVYPDGTKTLLVPAEDILVVNFSAS